MLFKPKVYTGRKLFYTSVKNVTIPFNRVMFCPPHKTIFAKIKYHANN